MAAFPVDGLFFHNGKINYIWHLAECAGRREQKNPFAVNEDRTMGLYFPELHRLFFAGYDRSLGLGA